MSTRRDLYLTTISPALAAGRDMRAYACVRALAMLGPLDFAYVPHDTEEPDEAFASIENVRYHKITPSRGFRRAAVYASKRLQGVPPGMCRGTSPELIETGEALAASPGRGRVIVGDVNAATAMMALARRRPVIYNAHNFESDYVRGPTGPHVLSRALIRNYERRLIGVAYESWMVSRADVQSAQALVPGARVRYVPNVVDVHAIQVTPARHGRTAAEAGRLLMVGDFTYAPNIDGRELLVQSVLPLVWEKMPDVRLTLAGRGMDDWRSPDERIEAAGFVEDLAVLYRQADCVVVPIKDGAGSPLKFIEALAYAVPVVATPKAARGLEVREGVHFRQGEDAASLAAGILEVLREGGAAMAAEGRLLAEREYSIESLAERIAA
jgi:glycosyltransferase involved in cell wall biosynthesis